MWQATITQAIEAGNTMSYALTVELVALVFMARIKLAPC